MCIRANEHYLISLENGNWLHFDISSFEKTENVCGVCICAQTNI